MTIIDALRRDASSPAATARVAVIAHRRKQLGGGLLDLRRSLAEAGISDPDWFEVPKSKKAPRAVRRALGHGAEMILVWGGDGTVQRCLDALVTAKGHSDVTVGILPAGTANLLATNLGIPHDLPAALEIALSGRTRRLDLGVINGEHFAVMAGAGFDARMIDDADNSSKVQLGRLAYVRSGVAAVLLEHGVAIWNYRPTMLHAKLMTVDGRIASIGSANFNHRSCCLDEEINVVALDSDLVAVLDHQFDEDLERSSRIGPIRWHRRSLAQRTVEHAVAPVRRFF